VDYVGSIRARLDGPVLTFDAWCAFVKGHPGLSPLSPRPGKNPRTGEPMMIQPRPDAVWILVDGEQVGFAGWTQADADQVDFWGDMSRVTPEARQIADELNAEFVRLG
jgi:hypothetical protein